MRDAVDLTTPPPDGMAPGLLRSMTGCGEGTARDEAGSTCRVELRCVNNRFFKFSLRARDGFSALEAQAEAMVRGRVKRGSVQMALDLSGAAGLASRRLDAAQLATYFDDLADFSAARDLPAPTAIEPLLSLPGVVVDGTANRNSAEHLWPLVSTALEAALDALERMRCAEGAALARDMRATCGEIRALAGRIADRAPQIVADARSRLLERLRGFLEPQGVPVSSADVAREAALVAEKCDINEELVRLDSHLDQFDRLLASDAPGRPLDFLAQELAREANTIAAKSPDAFSAHAVVEIKSRIERLREQVQNVE